LLNIKGVAGLIVVVALVAAPSALAGTATYNSTGPLHVSDSSTSSSKITVPPGRTRIQSVEVTNFRVFWPASGQEMSTEIVGPDGTLMNLFEVGCFLYDPADIWTFSDGAALSAPNAKNDPKCNLGGGAFRPVDLPENRKLSIFSGKDAAGTWTLRATDSGVQFTNQGDIQTWALTVVHAPPTMNASAPRSSKLGKSLAATVLTDANGSLVTGGAAEQSATPVKAGAVTNVPIKVTKKIRKKVAKKGKATVSIDLAFTDETGGTANKSVSVKLKKKKKRK
jgi:hypothetical protein